MRQLVKLNKVKIISGIEPGKKGAGKFLSFLIKMLKESNVNIELNYLRTPDNKIVKILRKSKFYKNFKEIYYVINRKIIRLSNSKNKAIIIFHPQSLGLKNSINLIHSNNKIFIYVLDNFFFCKKSYNHINNTNTACLLCLDNIRYSLKNNCLSFPNKYSHNEYNEFILAIEANKDKIVFLTQNDLQSNLLRIKYGPSLNIQKIGMFTGEFSLNDKPASFSQFDHDILYHNTLAQAKGIKYFIELCNALPNYSFAIPYSKEDVEKVIGKINYTNIKFIPCNWKNGLLNLVQKSKITVVPSLWSTTIEGALLKSLFFGNTVAVVSQEYAFNLELPDDICLRLVPDIAESANILSNALKNKISLKNKAIKWVQKFTKDQINTLEEFSNAL